MMKEKSQTTIEGVDRGWSWVIALACCFGSLVLAGIFRTSGVLFVAFISTYGVTREEASWPMVVCIAVLNLTGPFSGTLGQKFGTRPIVMIGAVIATTGIASCYFTTSLKLITVLFGGVFGIGYGFINTLMPVILNAYFLNLRATANGIANAGSCFGSIILPIVFEYLISSYGLSGCFLLTGGIVLHLTIAGALMRPPPWMSRRKLQRKAEKEQISVAYKSAKPTISTNSGSSAISSKIIHIKTYLHADKDGMAKSTNSALVAGDLECAEAESLICQQDKVSPKILPAVSEPPSAGLRSTNTDNSCTSERKLSYLSYHEPSHKKFSLTIFQSFISVLTCPMFYVTAVTNVCFYFLYHMYVVIIVDYALDINVPEVDTKNILFAFSIADLFGRLCLGWITDRKYVSRARYVMLCMMMIGVAFFAFPYADGYSTLILVSCVYGLLLGCTMVVFPILLVDFCGIELHAVAYGCMCFMNGFASFTRPFLIGYFRDNIGSYSSIFYILGSLSVAASILWLLELCFNKKQNAELQQAV